MSERSWLELGRTQYRKVFGHDADATRYVLADLRAFAQASYQQTDILESVRLTRDELVRHAARVEMYRRILMMLDLKDSEIDEYERTVRIRMQNKGGPE